MRILGIDFGTRRIGVAVAEEDGAVAVPLTVIASKGTEQDIAALRLLVTSENAGSFVIGDPLHLSGKRSDMAAGARAFGAAIEQAFHLPVSFFDERYSSLSADMDTAISGAPRDAVAAAGILESYLARRKHDREKGEE